jgi:hypothetical protein
MFSNFNGRTYFEVVLGHCVEDNIWPSGRKLQAGENTMTSCTVCSH